ncbi:MAG: universal stress protein [Chitinivibrionales bacterium]
MLNRLLIPIQGRESNSDVTSLLEFTRRFSSSHVTFLHCGPETNRMHAILKPLKETAESIGMGCDLLFRRGHIPSVICYAVGDTESDIVCFPWRGKTVLQRTLFGSVSKDVIRLSQHPVFIFKKRLQYYSKGVKLTSILYATDFQAIDREIMPYLAYEGLEADKLIIMNVGTRAPDPEAEKSRVQAVKRDLNRLKSECEESYETLETIVEIGSARRKIVKQAKRNSIDLIVTGKGDRSVHGNPILGSTAEYIPHHSNCSMMIIPGG